VNLAGYLAAIGVLLNVAPLWAQQDSVLRAAVQMETEGRGDSARAIVRARLAALGPTDSLYPEVLFTAGVVAGNADTASTYFRRVSIEFARSERRPASGQAAPAWSSDTRPTAAGCCRPRRTVRGTISN
jgi:hypothetical protein